MSPVIVDVSDWDPIDFWVDTVCRDDEHDVLFAIKSKASPSTIKYDRKLRCYLKKPVVLCGTKAMASGGQAGSSLGGESVTVQLDDVVVVGDSKSSQHATKAPSKRTPGSAATQRPRASTQHFPRKLQSMRSEETETSQRRTSTSITL
ncbi:hypothetical protein FI667_g10274, partial [Globisporangium splendens]